MFLDYLFSGSKQHLRRAVALLDEANMARLEHQAAAEHHAALAKMYTERAKRLEREIQQAGFASATNDSSLPEDALLEQPPMYALNGNGRAPKARSLAR
ncbi:MAG: hypothetical protein ABWZ88_16430 [Variovorax sp.]